MTKAMEAEEAIERYLLQLRLALTGVSERDEILTEIRSHIVDRLADTSLPVQETAEDTLRSLGSPMELARAYRSRGLMATAAASISPMVLLRATYRWAMTGIRGFVVFFILVFGYVVSIGFYVCALFKPIFPDRVGLFIGPDQFGFGVVPPGMPLQNEVLGPYFIPVALVIASLALIGTTKFVRSMISRYGGIGRAVLIRAEASRPC